MMNTISKILIPFDFTPLAHNALKYAISYCHNHESTQLTLLYCTNDLQIEEKSAMMKSTLAEVRVPSNIHIQGKVVIQTLTDGVLEFADENHVHLIVMGTKSSDRVSDKAVSNTAMITLQAACPVLVVPENHKTFRLKNITLAIGSDEIEQPEVLSTLLVMAREFDAKIHVLSIAAEDSHPDIVDTKTESILEYYFEKFYAYTSYVASKNIAASIMEYDRSKAIDLLAIIPRNHVEQGTKSEGRLTAFLTMNTNIPLLTMNLPH